MMERLYPIIRRARRPLVIKDDDSEPAGLPASAPVPVLREEAAVSYAKRSSSAEKGKRASPSAIKRKE